MPDVFQQGGVVVAENLAVETWTPLPEVLARGPVDLPTLVDWGIKIAGMLAAAHRTGVAHGDLRVATVLIGADGTYSKMRALMFPDSAKPVFNGLSVWRYNFARPPGMNWGSVHYGRRAKAGLVPMSPGLMYMFVVTAEPGNPKMPRERMHDVMRGRLSDFTGIIAELREQIIDPAGVVYRPMEPMLLPAPWHRGRVLLIGDAVHATTPQLAQGASIAIEDAALLAQLLPQDRPLEDIFTEFMRRRFERCKFVVETSLRIGRWEVAAFEGRPDLATDYAGLMAEAGRVLAEAY